jgi:hypothetical protein
MSVIQRTTCSSRAEIGRGDRTRNPYPSSFSSRREAVFGCPQPAQACGLSQACTTRFSPGVRNARMAAAASDGEAVSGLAERRCCMVLAHSPRGSAGNPQRLGASGRTMACPAGTSRCSIWFSIVRLRVAAAGSPTAPYLVWLRRCFASRTSSSEPTSIVRTPPTPHGEASNPVDARTEAAAGFALVATV